MKKIQITNFNEKDKNSIFTKQRKHNIYLGNRIHVYYTDLKKAKAFIVSTNEFLNQKLFELNALYIDVFTEYRKSWFYFFNSKDSQLHNIGLNAVFMELETIEKKINFMVARSGYQNGSSIVWHSFKIAIESLQQIASSLNYLYKEKKHYSEAHQVKVILTRLTILSVQLQEWGKDQKEIIVYKN